MGRATERDRHETWGSSPSPSSASSLTPRCESCESGVCSSFVQAIDLHLVKKFGERHCLLNVRTLSVSTGHTRASSPCGAGHTCAMSPCGTGSASREKATEKKK